MSTSRCFLPLSLYLAIVLVASNSASAQREKKGKTGLTNKETRQGGPYYFPNCPISGKSLGSMGDPVIKFYNGREIRFCCPACSPKFEKDLQGNLSKIDGLIIEDQMPRYPLKTSVVSGKDLPDKPLDFVYGNRLIRLIDAQERERFLKEPARYIAELDKAVISQQSKNYPAPACVVSKEKLGGEMGKPVDIVLASRLIRLCCAHCKSDLEETPAVFVAKIDAARAGSRQKEGLRDDHGRDNKNERHGN